MSDESDYKDYQDYIEYQKHIAAPQQAPAPAPGILEKGIDLIPGMKDRRESIAQQRSSPEYKSSHPTPVTGLEDPAYSLGVGLVGPESLASMLSSGAKGLKGFFKPAADRAEVASKVKNITELEPYVQSKVSDASKAFMEKQVTPRIEQQYAKATEQYVPFKKEDFLGIHPELDAKVSELSQLHGDEIPMSKALDLKADLNSKTKFKTVGPWADTQAAQSKALDAGNKLRESINTVDPSVGQLSDELKTAYGVKKAALGNASKNPINALLPNDSAAGLAKKGRLATFDEQAGSDLSTLGRNIQTASDRVRPMKIGDLISIHGPKQVINKATAPVFNTYDKIAQSQVAAPDVDIAQKLRAFLQKSYGVSGSGDQ